MTNDAKHTPGQWKALYFEAMENDGAGTLIPTGTMKRVIRAERTDQQNRRCYQHLAEVFEQAAYPDQGAANAQIFAAAQDMLIALAWLVGLKDARPADYEEQKPLAWAAARAALAKATAA